MKTLTDIACYLRESAAEIEATAARLCLPVEKLTLAEAYAKVRAVAGTSMISISFEVRQYGHVEGFDTEWMVYDQSFPPHGKTFKEPSLEAAVNACLAAHAPRAKDPLVDVQSVLDGATTTDEINARALRDAREAAAAPFRVDAKELATA